MSERDQSLSGRRAARTGKSVGGLLIPPAYDEIERSLKLRSTLPSLDEPRAPPVV